CEECDFIYSNYYLINDKSEILLKSTNSAVSNGIFHGGGVRYSFYHTFLTNGGVAAFLYKRGILKNIGEYDEDLNGTEDWDYFIKILRKNPITLFEDLPLMYYRIHSKSMTSKMINS